MQGPSDEPLHAHALAHRNAQGLRALEKGNLSQAQRIFQEAHLLAPHDGRVLVNLGFSFHFHGFTIDILRLFKILLALREKT